MAFVDPFLCLRHSLGYSVASIDYDYGAREMDFCPWADFWASHDWCSGFPRDVERLQAAMCDLSKSFYHIKPFPKIQLEISAIRIQLVVIDFVSNMFSSHRITHLPRLTLYSVLNLADRALSLWAPVCSSWGIPCRATSGRSYINPLGNDELYEFVHSANCMVSRILGCKFITRFHHKHVLQRSDLWVWDSKLFQGWLFAFYWFWPKAASSSLSSLPSLYFIGTRGLNGSQTVSHGHLGG